MKGFFSPILDGDMNDASPDDLLGLIKYDIESVYEISDRKIQFSLLRGIVQMFHALDHLATAQGRVPSLWRRWLTPAGLKKVRLTDLHDELKVALCTDHGYLTRRSRLKCKICVRRVIVVLEIFSEYDVYQSEGIISDPTELTSTP
jgi:hypothetical protein